MDDLMLPLPGLSPVLGKAIVARFDGGQLSSDAGVLMLGEFEHTPEQHRLFAGIVTPERPSHMVTRTRSAVRLLFGVP